MGSSTDDYAECLQSAFRSGNYSGHRAHILPSLRPIGLEGMKGQ
jgi:hypothetical protein